MQQNWLSLNDYSIQYGVSVSTLRRRIKERAIECKLESGKYWLRNLPLREHKKIQDIKNISFLEENHKIKSIHSVVPIFPNARREECKEDDQSEKEQNYLSTPPSLVEKKFAIPAEGSLDVQERQSLVYVQELLQEIKKAYAIILQEKEEQILLLKDEVADLKTLVRVLEESTKNTVLEVPEVPAVSKVLENKTDLKEQSEPEIEDWTFSLDTLYCSSIGS